MSSRAQGYLQTKQAALRFGPSEPVMLLTNIEV